MSDVDKSFYNKVKKQKFRLSFIGIFAIVLMMIFMNLPGDMGTVNVKADFGTPTGAADAQIVSIGMGTSSITRENLAKWTMETDSQIKSIDVEDEWDSIYVRINWDTADLYDKTNFGLSCIKVIFSYEINNVTSPNYTLALDKEDHLYYGGSYFVTGYYFIDGLNESLEDNDWIELTVKLYVKLA